MSLIQQFSAYSLWRTELSATIQALQAWLHTAELSDGETDRRLSTLVERLRGDKLIVAVVAEFSRGKSELINALLFGDYGQRMLPSSAGRTTMCPTELEYDPDVPAQVALLPIETRADAGHLGDWKARDEAWVRVPLEPESVDAMRTSLQRVVERKRVAKETALALGFELDENGTAGLCPSPDGMVDIPAWRHAIINFPHPLLRQGLVILDTPGLNAIGAEPALTLSLLPNAHALLFILAADTGVTLSDLDVWRHHVPPGNSHGRLVALNKIDGLWDELRSEAEVEAEIARQVQHCAEILRIAPEQIFPVSARKALVAKARGSDELWLRSRMGALEDALASDLLPAKRQIVMDSISAEANALIERMKRVLDARLEDLRQQLEELRALQGKSQSVIYSVMLKVKGEKEEFDKSLQQYQAVHSVFATLARKLFQHLGRETLANDMQETRQAIVAHTFSRGLRNSMRQFFNDVRARLDRSGPVVTELTLMLSSMYKRFAVNENMGLATPLAFVLDPYRQDIDRIETHFDMHFSSMAILTQEKRALTRQIFDTMAAQVGHIFQTLYQDVEHWLRSVMSPLETQVREQQLQLHRRLESIKRINEARGTLEERISDSLHVQSNLSAHLQQLLAIRGRLQACLQPDGDEQRDTGSPPEDSTDGARGAPAEKEEEAAA